MSDDGYDAMDAEEEREKRERYPFFQFVRSHPEYTYGGVPEQRDVPEIEQWETGAIRDTQDGKPRYDLISPLVLRRTAEHLREGAAHYGEFNWVKGIPSQRYMASLLRHVEAYRAGERDEDHLAAIVFNVMGLMHNENTDLDDLFEW